MQFFEGGKRCLSYRAFSSTREREKQQPNLDANICCKYMPPLKNCSLEKYEKINFKPGKYFRDNGAGGLLLNLFLFFKKHRIRRVRQNVAESMFIVVCCVVWFCWSYRRLYTRLHYTLWLDSYIAFTSWNKGPVYSLAFNVNFCKVTVNRQSRAFVHPYHKNIGVRAT